MNAFNKIFLLILMFFTCGAFSLEKADIIYTGGIFGIPYDWVGDLPLGHVGLFAGTEKKDGKIQAVIIDCVPDYFKPGGIRKVSWKHFTHDFRYPYYGNRTTSKKPTAEQRENMVKKAESMLKPRAYSFLHDSQKGPDKFDCVGFVEYIYEKVGLNPTPNDQETGLGWPLTPSEQFYATVANSPSPVSSYISITKKRNLDSLESFQPLKSYSATEIPLPSSFVNE
ncbi:MAG: hypothetical protein Fur0012_08740 [Elusimicrobiota bacterium]